MTTFKEQLVADLAVFLNADEFAVEADLGEGADPRHIPVLIDESPVLVEGPAAAVRTATRQATCRSADIEGTKVGDTLFIGETHYRITDMQPDGAGLTTMILTTIG